MQANPSQHKGMTMKAMVAHSLVTNPNGINETVTASLSPAESKRNYAIAQNLNRKNYMGMDVTRVVLPNDAPGAASINVANNDDISRAIKAKQAGRTAEYYRQSSMPWLSHFMYTATDKQRLNNPAMQSFVQQRQLTIPSSYGQFYAFMHALSAAFGTLQSGGSN